MINEILCLVKGNGFFSGIQKYGCHIMCLRIFFSIFQKQTSGTSSPQFSINNKIVDMQVRASGQCMNRSHTHNADEYVVFKCAN